MVIILSDFMDKGGYMEGLRFLIARNMDVYVIQILSQEEIDPPLTGDLKLTDVEDGDAIAAGVSGRRKLRSAAGNGRHARQKAAAGRRGIRHADSEAERD